MNLASNSLSDVGPLYEVCGNCGNLYPTTQMRDIYVRNKKGEPVPFRFCPHCANPQVTYIVGHLKLFSQIDVPRILGLVFGLTIAVLNVIFAKLVGGTLGAFIAIAGILAGAGIALAFAVSIALPQGGGQEI